MDPIVYLFRANIRGATGDNEGALQDFNKAIGINPNNVAAYAGRGLSKISLGQKASGCRDISKAGKMGFVGEDKMMKEYCNK